MNSIGNKTDFLNVQINVKFVHCIWFKDAASLCRITLDGNSNHMLLADQSI